MTDYKDDKEQCRAVALEILVLVELLSHEGPIISEKNVGTLAMTLMREKLRAKCEALEAVAAEANRKIIAKKGIPS